MIFKLFFLKLPDFHFGFLFKIMQAVESKQKGYRETFKNTTIFGGVQIFNVLISIIRAKFVAVLLGPTGVGVLNLLNSPLSLISTITGLGLSWSAVRNISEANSSNDSKKIAQTIITVRKWFFFTGLIGAAVTIMLAPQLSKWSFGNTDYTWAFIWLSITLFLGALSTGQSTLLRGLRRISDMVKSGIIGSVLGLLTSIPLFYFYGIKGIVPSLIVSAISALILTWYFARKIKIEPVKLSPKEVFSEGLDMTKMGTMIVISAFLGNLTKYGINISIGKIGNIEDVGLFAAAMGISSQYIGFVLASLSTDFFPRLVAVNKDVTKTNETVNQQMEIVILIAAPLLMLMIITAPILIRLFLTVKFLVVSDFIRFVAIGSFLQAASYCMGYISFSKNDKRSYFLLEGVVSNFLLFFFNLIFYYLWGLKGLGISFFCFYATYFVIISVFTRWKYKYVITKNVLKNFFVMLSFLLGSLVILLLFTDLFGYLVAGFLFAASMAIAYKELDNLMDIKPILIRLKNKIFKK
jgi:O-antigen/teichoic acid export membrane protein